MSVEYVALDGASGVAWAGLRELCGYDEAAVDDDGTATALLLLDRLLVEAPHTHIHPGHAATLTAANRDRLLAAVYQRTYGDYIAGTMLCVQCGEPFDLDFSLQALLDQLSREAASAEVQQAPDGAFILPGGYRFRLPTGQDEVAVAHLSAAEAEHALLARCLLEGDLSTAPDAVQTAMEQVDPLLHLDLKGQCRSCGEYQLICFDMQSYVLRTIASERKRLAWEIHLVASTYGWGLEDILGLPRSQRHMFAGLIETERDQVARKGRWA